VDLPGPLMQKRYEGYQRAMREAGLKTYAFNKSGSPFEAGLQFADMLAAQGFEAAFCTEDMAAAGALKGMLKKGVQVGQEFGLVGFDNIHLGRQVYPELTTIDQNIFEKGEKAAKTLLEILNKKTPLGSRLILPVRLVTRETA